MIRGIYTAVSGMISQEAKQDVITNNIANSDTIGYKQDNLVIKKFNDILVQSYDSLNNKNSNANPIGYLSLGSMIDETSTDFSEGTIQNTGKSTDFAINGQGFFTVKSNGGNKIPSNFYTRDGSFHVDNNGFLVTEIGDSVMGTNLKSNAVEPIKVNNSKIISDSKNNIYLDGVLSYKFNMAGFTNTALLKKVGDNKFSGPAPNSSQNIVVNQNSIEKSNVNAINETINMMTVMRNFESNQKIISSINSTLDKAINEVGAVK